MRGYTRPTLRTESEGKAVQSVTSGPCNIAELIKGKIHHKSFFDECSPPSESCGGETRGA